MVPITVSAYRFTGFLPRPVPAAAAAGAAAPASVTPAPVAADLVKNFRRFNGISGSSRTTTNNARRLAR
ncbi:hypothetical protein GCM10010261_09160 [Streptomyces pilosus]|uniref:Uncharacterized protein n=1 Tax=Streptomyces pilosus TaxID=28893 RepID=A0A918BD10_9ACTN|nr:hypothetical protein GCM10010280_02400 [Streptomyces pilosus]GGV38218.1 hypothetical protein GCM10010261_09160 [Streptomyces pilosus]